MKKLMHLAILLLLSTAVFAQEGPRKGLKKGMNDFTPEQIAVLHTKKMTLALDLTTQQQKELLILNTELAKERRQHREERKALKEEGVKLSSEQRFEQMNERLDRQIEVHKKMKTLLNKEQYSLWKQHQLKKGKKLHKNRLEHRRNG
ncbi:hypothetical protein [Ascidiimonas sp. W6]|uniref:hypothetical protein n=1 Tax=Ascidiimonas meishanensis TaxID=3128903 RepID=UPI0030EBF37E